MSNLKATQAPPKRIPTIIDITNLDTGERCEPSSNVYKELAADVTAYWANGDPARPEDWIDDDGEAMDMSEPDEEIMFDEQLNCAFQVRLSWEPSGVLTA